VPVETVDRGAALQPAPPFPDPAALNPGYVATAS
jgi:hypothetical protein